MLGRLTLAAEFVALLCGLSPRAAADEGREHRAPAPPSVWQRAASVGIVGTSYAAAWVLVSKAWWTQEDSSESFHFRDEGAFGTDTYAGGADKLGHLYSNYLATRMVTGILEWGGTSRTASMASAALLTTAFFTTIELKDAYQQHYGFSVGDMAANLTGQAAAFGLMLLPELDEVVSIKLSYFPSRDYLNADERRVKLNLAEDYSGQTYLLCLHLASLAYVKRELSVSGLRYFDLSLGYAAVGYAPIPKTARPARQVLSLGVSLNLQRVVDELWDYRDARRSTARSVVHFANEVVQPPHTRIPVASFMREGAAPAR